MECIRNIIRVCNCSSELDETETKLGVCDLIYYTGIACHVKFVNVRHWAKFDY